VKTTDVGTGDPRPESRKVIRNGGRAVAEVGRIEDPRVRKWYAEKLLRPCSRTMLENKETIGIVKPEVVSYDITEFEPKKNPLNDEAQTTLSTWLDFYDPRRAQEEYKKAYATKDFELRFQFRCGPHCKAEKWHNMKVLDLEAFMLYRNVSKKYSDFPTIFQKMKDKITQLFEKDDIYFALGTHRLYPFHSFMIGAMIYIKKGTPELAPMGALS
jgi:hypothetical protein